MLTKDKIKTKIIRSTSKNPWYNLALEEYLLGKIQKDEVILYLWQNENTVVIGNNQNPWKEVKCKELELENGKLARRLSGGGAVFHDLGNLNFTFVMDKNLYDLQKQLEVILKSLKSLGINAEFSGRNDLVVDGKKFSGNAFYFGEVGAYHHGTLLIDVDMKKLQKYLNVSVQKMASKGIESVKSRVINLHDINEDVTIHTVIKSLKETFIQIYGGENKEVVVDETSNNIQRIYDRYSSWEWRYGQTPSFDIEFEKRFTWGEIHIGLELENAKISKSVIYSDAMNSEFVKVISNAIEGAPFDMEHIINKISKLKATNEEEIIKTDIKDWLSNIDI